MTLQVFPKASGAGPERLELIGDPARLPGAVTTRPTSGPGRRSRRGVALGLGALGPSFEACRGRFGEFLAVAGVAAYRPSAGPGRPDFEQAAGAFVPEVRRALRAGVPGGASGQLVRFEAKGEPGSASVPLSQLAEACLDQAGGGVVGIVLAGETDGLVGAALRRSPVGSPAGLDPFAHPEVRDWLSLTPEPEHSRSTALVVGVATREASPALAPFVRPLSGAGRAGTPGPLPRGGRPVTGRSPAARSSWRATVPHLFEPGRIETILHLLGDSRPILGAGESTFTRGVIWYVPLAVGRGGGVAMTLLIGSWTVGLILALLALGVFISFRIFAFPDITADGSLTLGAAVAAALIVRGYSPWAATAAAMLAGALAGGTTGVLHTRFQINGLLAGILVATALYSVNLHVMGRSNIPLLDARTVGTDLVDAVAKVSGPVESLRLLGREVRFRDAVNLAAVGAPGRRARLAALRLPADEPGDGDAGHRRQPPDDPVPGRRRGPDDHARADDVQRAGGALGRDPGAVPGLRRRPDGHRHDRLGPGERDPGAGPGRHRRAGPVDLRRGPGLAPVPADGGPGAALGARPERPETDHGRLRVRGPRAAQGVRRPCQVASRGLAVGGA